MIERPLYARVCKTPQQFLKMQEDLLHEDLGLPKYVMSLPIELTIRKWKPRRTDQQNRYLFGVVYALISQETGNEIEALHEYYLGRFFGWEEIRIFDKIKMRPRERSSKQVKARFSEFLEFVISHAAENGIIVPPPENDKTW